MGVGGDVNTLFGFDQGWFVLLGFQLVLLGVWVCRFVFVGLVSSVWEVCLVAHLFFDGGVQYLDTQFIVKKGVK